MLAETGLLDGLRTTTHWLEAANFAKRFPKVKLDPQVLFVREGRIVTSAGAAAGMDVGPHIVARDQGHAIAAKASRLAVGPLRRNGEQAHFIRYNLPRSYGPGPLLGWMLANRDSSLSVEKLALRAVQSPRTFALR